MAFHCFCPSQLQEEPYLLCFPQKLFPQLSFLPHCAADMEGGMGWQEGEREEPLRLVSEIVFLDSFTLAIIFTVGAFKLLLWRVEGCIVAPSRIPLDAPVELPSFVMRQVGLASLKSTFPVNISFLTLSAYQELFNLFCLIFL